MRPFLLWWFWLLNIDSVSTLKKLHWSNVSLHFEECDILNVFIAHDTVWIVRMIFSMMISSPQPFFQMKLKFFSAFLSFLCKWNKPLDSNKLSADETFIWNYILNNFRCMQRIHWFKFQLQLSFYVFPTDILSRNSIPAIGVVLSDSEVLEWY